MNIKPLPTHPLVDAYAQATSESEKIEIASVFADHIYPTHPGRSELMALILAHGGVLPRKDLLEAVRRLDTDYGSPTSSRSSLTETVAEVFLPHGFITTYSYTVDRVFALSPLYVWAVNEPITKLQCSSRDDLQRIDLRRLKEATFSDIDLFGAWTRTTTSRSLQTAEMHLHQYKPSVTRLATSQTRTASEITDALCSHLQYAAEHGVRVLDRITLYTKQELYESQDVSYFNDRILDLKVKPKHIILKVTYEGDMRVFQTHWTGNEFVQTSNFWKGFNQ